MRNFNKLLIKNEMKMCLSLSNTVKNSIGLKDEKTSSGVELFNYW